MSENSNGNATPKQMEDDILALLDGEQQQIALQFDAFLQASGLTVKQDGPTDWKIPYNGNNLCMIQLDPGNWRFTFFFGDYRGQFDVAFITTVHKNVKICTRCHDGCMFGIDTVLFGKEFENVCSQLTIQIDNPGSDTLEHIKMLIEYGKRIAPDSVSWHAHH